MLREQREAVWKAEQAQQAALPVRWPVQRARSAKRRVPSVVRLVRVRMPSGTLQVLWPDPQVHSVMPRARSRERSRVARMLLAVSQVLRVRSVTLLGASRVVPVRSGMLPVLAGRLWPVVRAQRLLRLVRWPAALGHSVRLPGRPRAELKRSVMSQVLSPEPLSQVAPSPEQPGRWEMPRVHSPVSSRAAPMRLEVQLVRWLGRRVPSATQRPQERASLTVVQPSSVMPPERLPVLLAEPRGQWEELPVPSPVVRTRSAELLERCLEARDSSATRLLDLPAPEVRLPRLWVDQPGLLLAALRQSAELLVLCQELSTGLQASPAESTLLRTQSAPRPPSLMELTASVGLQGLSLTQSGQ